MDILIVDDEPVSRASLRRFAEQWGYEVDVAKSGEEAWQMWQESDYAIVLADWLMPGMDGIELVERIREQQTDRYVYLIIVTIRSEVSDLVEGMEAGADDYVTKPFAAQEVRVRLQAGERIVRLERQVERKRRRLEDAHDSLVQSEKMAGLGRLALGLSHEINNPLSLVKTGTHYLREKLESAVDLLERYETLDLRLDEIGEEERRNLERLRERVDLESLVEELGRVLDRLERGADRIAAIVDKLGDLVDFQSQTLEVVDLEQVVRETAERVEEKLEAQGLELEITAEGEPQIDGHRKRVGQVVSNLILNAIDASEPGDTIRVRVRHRDDSPLDEPAVALVVEDEGVGIPEKIRSKLFDAFFTTKEVGTATGLGLFLSYQFVRQHRGDIDISSEPDEGTRVVVWFPVDQEQIEEVPELDKPWKVRTGPQEAEPEPN
ncbi:MAG: response regulator [Bradymonadaceae bacterium]